MELTLTPVSIFPPSYQVQWVGPDEDTFFQEWEDDATQLHPVTKEKVT